MATVVQIYRENAMLQEDFHVRARVALKLASKNLFCLFEDFLEFFRMTIFKNNLDAALLSIGKMALQSQNAVILINFRYMMIHQIKKIV